MHAKSAVFTVALFIAGVTAQTGMSQCVQNCISQSVKASTCSGATDVSCMCTNAQFQTAMSGCLSSNCPDELSGAQSAQAQQCSDIGVNTGAGSDSGSGAAPSGTAPSTSASQPAQDPASGGASSAGSGSGAGAGQAQGSTPSATPGTGSTPTTGAGAGSDSGADGASSPAGAGGASPSSVRPSITGPVTSPSGAASSLSPSFGGVGMVWALAASLVGGVVGAGIVL